MRYELSNTNVSHITYALSHAPIKYELFFQIISNEKSKEGRASLSLPIYFSFSFLFPFLSPLADYFILLLFNPLIFVISFASLISTNMFYR